MADYHGVIEPTESTLKRYGLTRSHWRRLCRRAHFVCQVCLRLPVSGRLVIDHEHVPGWKHLPDGERVKYVRGLLCHPCNHYVLTRYADAWRHRQAAKYLDRFTRRFDKGVM